MRSDRSRQRPASIWPAARDRVAAMMKQMRIGDVADFRRI